MQNLTSYLILANSRLTDRQPRIEGKKQIFKNFQTIPNSCCRFSPNQEPKFFLFAALYEANFNSDILLNQISLSLSCFQSLTHRCNHYRDIHHIEQQQSPEFFQELLPHSMDIECFPYKYASYCIGHTVLDQTLKT